ncbi:MAG: putative metallopeptidase [Candidatus Pacearchaeota archaeon]|nr:putative metallopeptidase [Candidatus Pacearchaeota archaeon]
MTNIKYQEAQDVKRKIELIIKVLELKHINPERVYCVRSQGSSSKGIIARCHSLPKILQQVLGIEPAYVIEIISETFDKQKEEEQIKTLIHELLHIPKTFGGGFLHHNVITRAKIDKLYNKFKKFENSSLSSKNIDEQKI